MKNILKLSMVVAALAISNGLFAQTAPKNGSKNNTNDQVPNKQTTTVNGTNDGMSKKTTTNTTGTSEKMAIGDQGTVEDKNTKSGTRNNANNQITPKK
ncbi:MAG TPA: hypothetical protein VI112_01435 [Bacteroidia bacterium]|jgi:hypothetical protein